MRANFKSWRQSASIIMAAKTNYSPLTVVNEANFKVLMLKRSEKVGSLPGAYVFPGGIISHADTTREWLKLYEKFGFQMDAFDKLYPNECRPLIFEDDDQDCLPKYLSLRINAIRETFEECGILICRSFKINYKERLARWCSFIGGHEILKWQNEVHSNPEKFIELCSEYEIYPDVWSLKLWSNWVTPMPVPSKFDTVFFLAAFDQTPPSHPEMNEIQRVEWQTASAYLLQSLTEEISMLAPQFYEISRLKVFLDVSQLLKFAAERAQYGCERYFPQRVGTDEGVVSILPGDDLYPKNISEMFNEAMPYLKSLPYSHVQNRMLHEGVMRHTVFTKNFVPKCHHVAPPFNV